MTRRGAIFLSALLMLFLIPSLLSADYLYPGSSTFQPLAVIEPATPDSLFYSWTGEIDQSGPANLGVSLDFLRNAENSDDWDVIFSTTGAFRSGEKFLFGITVPYIIRDPELNESDLLDLRVFARMKLLRGASDFGVSGELSAILPTADEGTVYPFTLDTAVTGLRLAFSGAAGDMMIGGNIGYQNYLQTQAGKDSDLLYSVWTRKPLQDPWSLTVEYSGSTHSHTGAPGDDEISDNYVSVGVQRVQSEKTTLGLAAVSGIGGDTSADIRIKALAQIKFGTVDQKKADKNAATKRESKRKASAAVTSKVIAIMIAESVTSKDVEKRITKALQHKGYATGMDPDPGIKSKGRNILYYMPGMQEQAISVSRTLSFGGHLKDLRIEESKVPITGNWLLLVLGGGEVRVSSQ